MGRVEIDGLTKIFDDGDDEIVAVDDLDLTIQDGEFLVLVGPSGCGKSTTLRTIAGLEQLTEGDLRINGTSITGRKPKDRNIAMVFQNYALYPHMNARENMGFGLKMTTDLPREEIQDRIQNTSAMMGIEDLLDKKPGELSGGQQQRVALGRAIVRDPEVFLMDEPLSNLDAKLRTTMRTEIQDLQQDLDTTTIYVTHDQVEAMTMGDRIAVLNHGQLQQVGTPLELYHRPANRFVAGFIGSPSMNFMEIEVAEVNGEIVFEHDVFTYPVSQALAETIAGASSTLTIGYRPEDIELVEEEDNHTMLATVNVVEPLGDINYAYMTVGEEDLTVSVPAGRRLAGVDEIPVRFPEDRLYLFDGESGDAIKHPIVDLDDDLAAEATGVGSFSSSPS